MGVKWNAAGRPEPDARPVSEASPVWPGWRWDGWAPAPARELMPTPPATVNSKGVVDVQVGTKTTQVLGENT